MKLSRKSWNNYVTRLSAINKTAGRKMQAYIDTHGTDDVAALVEYAYALTTKYGEAASAAACQMYDEIAELQKAHVPLAEPKQTQHIKYVDKAIRSTLDRAPSTVPSTVSEMVKRTGAETTLKNAQRDGAYFAWVPNGDTCAFCITLASNGWRRASKKAINGDHAEHIHKNCDCEFAISFNGPGDIEGYDPDKYLSMYEGAEGTSWKDKVNAMRRADYAANRDAINAQKRAAYARRNTNALRMKTETTWGGMSRQNTEEEINKLKEFALDKGIVLDPIFESFDGDVSLVKDFVGRINDNIENVSFMRKKKIKLSVSYTMMDDTYAQTEGSKITINGFAFRDREILQKSYEQKVEEGWFTKGSTHLDIATHESCHLIVYMNQLRTKNTSIEVFGGNKVKAAQIIRKHVSEYALFNNSELIAESYVAYKNGSKDEYVLKVLKHAGII